MSLSALSYCVSIIAVILLHYYEVIIAARKKDRLAEQWSKKKVGGEFPV